MNLLLVILLSSSPQSYNPMGFDQEKTTHHFVLTSSGGHIEVTVRDASDHANLSAIREHLTHIAVQFKAGDFNIPVLVHGEKPPGSEVMKQRNAHEALLRRLLRAALVVIIEYLAIAGRPSDRFNECDSLITDGAPRRKNFNVSFGCQNEFSFVIILIVRFPVRTAHRRPIRDV